MIFKGKKVLITGASSGIGEALGFAFNGAGAEVVLVARNEKELHRVQTKLNQNFSSWVYIHDISKYEQADAFALKIINVLNKKFGIIPKSALLNTYKPQAPFTTEGWR